MTVGVDDTAFAFPTVEAKWWLYINLQPFRRHMFVTTADGHCDLLSCRRFPIVQSGTHGTHNFAPFYNACPDRWQAQYRYNGLRAEDWVTMAFAIDPWALQEHNQLVYNGTRHPNTQPSVVITLSRTGIYIPWPIPVFRSEQDRLEFEEQRRNEESVSRILAENNLGSRWSRLGIARSANWYWPFR